MRYLLLAALSASMLVLASCGGDGNEDESTPPLTVSPSQRSTPRRTADATATPGPQITRPDPETLVPAGYALDQALDASLDDSQAGQIVVVSHTIRKDKSGKPVLGALPENCPSDPLNGSPCAFRIEVFTYDRASGWTSSYVDDHGGEFDGAEQSLTAQSFRLDGADRDALLVTSDRATGTGSGTGLAQTVLSMERGELLVAYASGLKASVVVESGVAVVTEPHFADADPLCCPSARRITRVGFDEASGEVRVLDEQLVPVN